MPETTPHRESLKGSIERVTYHNQENGYCVLRVKAKGQRDEITVVGYASTVSAGEHIESLGSWTQHKEFGLQFKADSIRTVHPSTLEGIEKYLGSGMIKGIGPHFAKKLVKAFGFKVFEVIEQEPKRLGEVNGIGPVRIEKITTAWKDQKVVRDIMVFLQSHGVSTAKAVRIYKTYGQDSVARVKANPYQLARDIHGIGFKSADVIAGNLGIPKDSIVRARAGVNYVLLEQTNDGHCAYPKSDLIEKSAKLLEIEPTILEEAVAAEIEDKFLIEEAIDGEACLYPAGIYRCEVEVAKLLSTLAKGSPPWGEINAEKALAWAEQKLSIMLAPLQREAVIKALSSKLMIITGGPGTGKTTLTRTIVSIVAAKKMDISLCSPTGRAAKRLSEVTGMEAKTIHRLLGVDGKKGGFQHNKENPLPIDLLLVDETSMVDISLMYSLLKAIPSHAALIIVGDVDQIPSVGPGCVLAAALNSSVIPTVKLTEIFRQAAKSQIIQNAHKINHGQFPALDFKDKDSDFHFISSEEPEKTIQLILDLVKTRIPKKFGFNPVKDIQVLCPMNRGGLGARSLNIDLQKTLNPNPTTKIERFGFTFAPGDKVMVTVNDYDKNVFNGDIGFIKSIDLEEQEVAIDFDGNEVQFDFGEMDILQLAYAATIHKSQGSEYPAVVIPVATQHYMMLKRNLIYTGVTRGKKLVVMVGQKKALAIAVKSQNQGKRWNKLDARLKEASASC